MKRRTFFQSLARGAAIVALAPQLAFRVKPEALAAPVAPDVALDGYFGVVFWSQNERFEYCISDEYTDAVNELMKSGPHRRPYSEFQALLAKKRREAGQ